MTRIMRRRCAVLALTLACAGTPAAAGVIIDNFEGGPLGGVPAGWGDVATVDPTSTAPKPSAVVVSTTDAFGNPTQAVSTLNKPVGPLPTTGPTHGILRQIPVSSLYSASANVRIDRFSDFTNYNCGCPPLTADWPMMVGYGQFQGTLDPGKAPGVLVYASSEAQNWRLLVYTANVIADFDLGVPVTLGTWYNVQFDLDVAAGTGHTRITDIASGATLADGVTVFPAAWDPAVDGVLDFAGFFGGYFTAVQQSGLATIDNVRVSYTPVPEPGALMLLASALLALGAVAQRRV